MSEISNAQRLILVNSISISVPPNTPQITSGDKRIDTSGAIAGVYNEGDVMNLTCSSTGGNFIHYFKLRRC